MLYVLAAVSVAATLLLIKVLCSLGLTPCLSNNGRFKSIDGIRGFLALAVFFHHALITYHWKLSGEWEAPPNHVYENFGSVGVGIFFMITGFLFIGKLSSGRKVNWIRLYESRLFRIVPLYLFALTAISLTVLVKTEFSLSVSRSQLSFDYLKWFLFHGGEINDFNDTKKIIAGVDWTLRYEWLFYLSLPLVALIMRCGVLAFSAFGLIIFTLFLLPLNILTFDTSYLIYFFIGGCVSLIQKRSEPKRSKPSPIKHDLLALLLIAYAVAIAAPLSLTQIGTLGCFFYLIANGSSLFKLLHLPTARVLGEISYSIYLLHGLVLYLCFSLLFSIPAVWDAQRFMLLLPLLSIIVVILAIVTFKLIEAPGISLGKAGHLEKWLIKRLGKKNQTANKPLGVDGVTTKL